MIHDGDKRKGRFIKKDSPIYNIVKVNEFNFQKVSKKDPIFLDNPRENIIHHKLHSQKGIDKRVNGHEELHKSLIDIEHLPPIIKPRDFTEDWLEQRKRAKKRAAHMDEDEYEMALEEDEEDEEENEDEGSNQPQVEMTSEGKDLVHENLEESENQTGKPIDETKEKSNLEIKANDVSQSVKKLKQLQTTTENEVNNIEGFDEALKNLNQQTTPQPESMKNDQHNHQENHQPIDMQEIDEIKKTAAEKGYQEGIDIAGKKFEELSHTVSNIIAELNNTKKNILSNVQENFYEVAKAICESIIEKHISINPEIWENIINKAIESTIKDDVFTVEVNSDLYHKLKTIPNLSFAENLQENSSIEENKFKINSELSVVESGAKEIIKEIIDNIDINLFET